MGTPTNTSEPMQIEGLLRCDEVAALVSVSKVTLAEWRRLGKGPKFIRMNGRVCRYRSSDVEAWLRGQEVEPSRLTGLTPNSGLGQYFQRYERQVPVESASAAPAAPAAAVESRDRGAAGPGDRGRESL